MPGIEGQFAVIEQSGLFYVVVAVGGFQRIVGPAPNEAAARAYLDELIQEAAGDDCEVIVRFDRNKQQKHV